MAKSGKIQASTWRLDDNAACCAEEGARSEEQKPVMVIVKSMIHLHNAQFSSPFF